MKTLNEISELPKHIKRKSKVCPDCGKDYIKHTKYTDGSSIYIHKRKQGSFGFTEIEGCFIKSKIMKHTKGKIKLQHRYTPNILIGKQYNSGTDAEFATYVSHPSNKMDKAIANAKRLIKCWNMHDELLEALTELIECDYTSGTHLSCAISKGKIVIKKAL